MYRLLLLLVFVLGACGANDDFAPSKYNSKKLVKEVDPSKIKARSKPRYSNPPYSDNDTEYYYIFVPPPPSGVIPPHGVGEVYRYPVYDPDADNSYDYHPPDVQPQDNDTQYDYPLYFDQD